MKVFIITLIGRVRGPTGVTQPDSTDAIVSMTSRAGALSVPRLPQLLYRVARTCLVGVIPYTEGVRGVDGYLLEGRRVLIGARITGYDSVVREESTSSVGQSGPRGISIDLEVERHAAFVVADVAGLGDSGEGIQKRRMSFMKGEKVGRRWRAESAGGEESEACEYLPKHVCELGTSTFGLFGGCLRTLDWIDI